MSKELLELNMALSKFGNVQLLREGKCFSMLITGDGLSNWNTYNKILGLVSDFTKEKYPIVEAIKNEKDFFCMVLVPDGIFA